MVGVVCSALAVWRAADEVNMERWIGSQVWQERCRLCVQRSSYRRRLPVCTLRAKDRSLERSLELSLIQRALSVIEL
jgi:hypothetical protein